MTSLICRGVGIAGRLQPTDFDATAGELIALVGPNGGGKTSLLRSIARIEAADGQVRIDREDVDEAPMARRRRLLSFLPASRDVTWPIACRDVIALGLEGRDDQRIRELIEQFELEGLADRPVDRLSTGERARVLAARAFASCPRLLLLDEPLSNLEPYWVLRFLEMVRQAADAGQTVIVALHDINQISHFDRALLIADGRVQMDEAPASLLASERFEEIFRIRSANGRWSIRPRADPRSSP